MWSLKILFTLSRDISSLYFQIIHLYPILLYHYFYGLNYSIFNLTEHSQLRFSRTGAPADRRQMSETTVTLEDFEGLQAQLLQMKTENYNLLEQVEAAKKRSSLTPQQIAEKLRVDNLQMRVRLNQCMKEKEQLTEQLKLVKIAQFLQSEHVYEMQALKEALARCRATSSAD